MNKNLPTVLGSKSISQKHPISLVPGIIFKEGEHATRRYLEFFMATIRNPNTRSAYYRATSRFFSWCESRNILNVIQVEPIVVAAYIEELQNTYPASTVKQGLAAIRGLFDWLVTGQVVRVNPAASVKGPRHVIREGKTSMLDSEEARKLFSSFKTDNIVGLRDRAIVGVMTYTFARVSAVSNLKVEDYFPEGKRWYLRLQEKGGKGFKIPVNHVLESYLDEYIQAAENTEDKKAPLFRTAWRRSRTLTDRALTRSDILRMVYRRSKEAGIQTKTCCHSFRARGITSYLDKSNGGSLEMAQKMAGHASPRTTKLYDRTRDEITVEEVERIRI